MVDADERELICRLRKGDQLAFYKIYAFYSRPLAQKLMHLLRSEELAEDILQDIFVKVWEIRHTINPDLSFAALIFKMAANLSKNVYRRNLYDQLMRNSIPPDPSHNPIEEQTNQSDAKALLESALNKLTPRQKQVYVMHKLEGLSYHEISAALQISTSAINHHIQEANKQIKILLRPNYIYILMSVLPFLK